MTKLVGILNVTPDSFSDSGLYLSPEAAEMKIAELFEQGADIVDIGAESTRPDAIPVTVEEEWRRLAPVVDVAKQHYHPQQFSFDTRHATIVKRIIRTWSGEVLINDVTGLHNKEMATTVAANGLRAVVSHLPARAKGSIPAAHNTKMESVSQVKAELDETVTRLEGLGIERSRLIVDPGIGFGKSPELNRRLVEFAKETSLPVMIGYSRKRFLGEHRFDPEPNLMLGRLAIAGGAAYLRVHDVRMHATLLS